MDIQITFDKPLEVSTSSKDRVTVSFKNEDLFVDEYDQSLKIDTKLTSDIPTQFPDAATKEAVESTASLLKLGIIIEVRFFWNLRELHLLEYFHGSLLAVPMGRYQRTVAGHSLAPLLLSDASQCRYDL